MILCHTHPYETAFLLRSPSEIREDLCAMSEDVDAVKSKLTRLHTVKEELEELVLPEAVLSLVENELLERIADLRDEMDEMASDVYALSEELEETVYLLYHR